jgi:hypothetical protein
MCIRWWAPHRADEAAPQTMLRHFKSKGKGSLDRRLQVLNLGDWQQACMISHEHWLDSQTPARRLLPNNNRQHVLRVACGTSDTPTKQRVEQEKAYVQLQLHQGIQDHTCRLTLPDNAELTATAARWHPDAYIYEGTPTACIASGTVTPAALN